MKHAATIYAGFWRRLAATALDITLVAAVFVTALLVWRGVTLHAEPWDEPATPLMVSAVAVASMLLGLWLDARFGGSPGKLLLGCRVVDARSGRRIGLLRSLWRGLAMLLSALPAGLGFLWIGWSRRKQGFHDLLAGTVVLIEDDARKSLAELAGEAR